MKLITEGGESKNCLHLDVNIATPMSSLCLEILLKGEQKKERKNEKLGSEFSVSSL